ncbi:MAG TPA: hypothetical protein VHO26_02745 [Propionibacteriaceae bacterium]|nr:hypothetical protein [Propionibacteriaceae bacterium]
MNEHEQPDCDASRDGRFEALLAESGVDLDDGLVSALADLESLGSGNPPVPSPTLRDLLEASDAASLAPRRRPGRRRARVAIATLTVAACLSGAGVAAAAAGSAGFRHSVGRTFAVVVAGLEGAGTAVRPTHDQVPTQAGGTSAPAAPWSTPARLLPPDPTSAARTHPSHQPSVHLPFPSASGILRIDPTPAGSPPRTTPAQPVPGEPSAPGGATGEPSAHPTRSAGARPPANLLPTPRPSPTRR